MSDGRVNRLTIRTPEGVRFSLLLAGPVTRFLAWLVDLLCVAAGTLALLWVVALVAVVGPGLAAAVAFLGGFLIWFGYGIVLEWFWQGRTIGKRLLRLRVMDELGLRLSFSQVVIRNLLRLVDMLPMLYLTGALACVLTRRAQRLGDLAANTVVVRTPKIQRPDLKRALGGETNSLRRFPHLQARLRQRVSPAAARVALEALLRRDELLPEARVALFGEIAGHFRKMVQFPPAATEGLSDEQYVRNVVDALFRPAPKV